MPCGVWSEIMTVILTADLTKLFDHNQVLDMLLEDTTDITTGDSIADEDESFEEKPFRVRGCFLSAVERLDEEFTKVILKRVHKHKIFLSLFRLKQ